MLAYVVQLVGSQWLPGDSNLTRTQSPPATSVQSQKPPCNAVWHRRRKSNSSTHPQLELDERMRERKISAN